MIGLTITEKYAKVGNVHYDYKDSLKETTETNEMNVLYHGQKFGRYDSIILDAIKNHELCKVYLRLVPNTGFTYLGASAQYEIIQERKVENNVKANDDEILIVKIKIPNALKHKLDLPPTNIYGKYKKQVMKHMGILHQKNNVCVGIYRKYDN